MPQCPHPASPSALLMVKGQATSNTTRAHAAVDTAPQGRRPGPLRPLKGQFGLHRQGQRPPQHFHIVTLQSREVRTRVSGCKSGKSSQVALPARPAAQTLFSRQMCKFQIGRPPTRNLAPASRANHGVALFVMTNRSAHRQAVGGLPAAVTRQAPGQHSLRH